MSKQFKDYVCEAEKYIDDLGASDLHTLDDLKQKYHQKAAGIYMFVEGDKPIYVGRTNNVKQRMQAHVSKSHNSAPFAFRLAEMEADKPEINLANMTREQKQKDPAFERLFINAIEQVRKMSVRFIEISDPIVQTLAEVGASIEYGTQKYNSFDNH